MAKSSQRLDSLLAEAGDSPSDLQMIGTGAYTADVYKGMENTFEDIKGIRPRTARRA